MAIEASIEVTVKDEKLKKIRKNLALFQKLVVQVGYYDGATYDDGDNPSVALIAFFHEFGTRNMPQRSFMRSALKDFENEIGLVATKATIDVACGASEPVPAAERMAQAMAFAVYKKLTTASQWAEPLTFRTIAGKGHDIPLFEVGKLRETLMWRVLDGGRMLTEGKASAVRGFD